jgi:succinate dehydrogenase/fumarate reductase cytochrome b subunit
LFLTRFFLVSSPAQALAEKALDKRAIELMLRAIVAVLLILWLLGFVLHLAGGIIHILAVIAVAVLIYDLVVRKKPVA